MIKYDVEVYNLDIANQEFNRLARIKTHIGLSWNDRLNQISGCRFKINFNDPLNNNVVLRRYVNVVAVKEYDDEDLQDYGTIIWAGPITNISGNYKNNNGYVNVIANSPLFHFESRYTDYERIFSATNTADIAWTLINESQSQTNGYLGISQGSLPSSVNRDRTYQRGKISELLVNLSNLRDGIDFEFQPVTGLYGKFEGWLFNVYYPRNRTFRTELNKLEFGQNILACSFNTHDEIYNYVTGLGAGTGRGTLISIQENSGSQLGNTRRESFYTNKDVYLQTTLDQQAQGELDYAQAEKLDIAITLMPNKNPTFGSFRLGDYLRIKLDKGYLNLDEWRLVKEIEHEIGENGELFITPVLSVL